jgi:hypothetical protein
LVIIDEEQRFGVGHKEHLKMLRRQVDVLTLSATPIPRTLYMALGGVRDMSLLETPPESRLPIRTYVGPYDPRLVKEAIRRELGSGGQVYYVHNRVQTIAHALRRVQELVPEARLALAHGQMDEEELALVMDAFRAQEVDVLVCTTIIEAGLDIPNVNTIIVEDAHRLGLAQLYQLRGRVGRSDRLAYAYLLYDRQERLTEAAQRRLQAIFEAHELGAGFQVALRDLEIRGGRQPPGPRAERPHGRCGAGALYKASGRSHPSPPGRQTGSATPAGAPRGAGGPPHRRLPARGLRPPDGATPLPVPTFGHRSPRGGSDGPKGGDGGPLRPPTAPRPGPHLPVPLAGPGPAGRDAPCHPSLLPSGVGWRWGPPPSASTPPAWEKTGPTCCTKSWRPWRRLTDRAWTNNMTGCEVRNHPPRPAGTGPAAGGA